MNDKNWLRRLDEALFERFQYLQRSKLPNGSFGDNVDLTSHAMEYLNDCKALTGTKEIVDENFAYLLEQQKQGRVRINPWTKEEEPKIAAVFVRAVAKVRGEDYPTLKKELYFIDSKIIDGEPQMKKIKLAQRPTYGSFDIEQAYSVTGRKNSEKAEELERYIIEKIVLRNFDPGSGHRLFLLLGGDTIRLELANKFLDTFVNYLSYPIENKQIQKALDYVKNNFSGTRYATALSDIVEPKEFFKIPYVGNMLAYEISQKSSELQDTIHHFGKLVRLRNKISEAS